MLNSREIASLILIGAAVVLAFAVPAIRRKVAPGLRQLWKAFTTPKVLVIFVGLFVWIAASLALGWLLHVWSWVLLPDAVIITIVLAIPMIFRITTVKTGGVIVRDLVHESVGIAALLAFYLNLETFPLWAELLLQPFLTILALLNGLLSTKPEWRRGRAVVGFIILLVIAGAAVWTTVSLVTGWSSLNHEELLLAFAQTLWLPLLLFPYLYGVAFLMAAELALVRMGSNHGTTTWESASGRVGFAIVLGLHGSVRFANRLVGLGRYDPIGRSTTFREARSRMKDFRADVRARDRQERQRLLTLKENAGVQGVDADGAQLDRREFDGTKRQLEWINTTQMGRYAGNGNRYWNDLTEMMVDVDRYGLPADHGIVVQTTPDRQRWRCWRTLPSGWVLGIGGSGPQSEWYYSGADVPTSWPGEPPWVDGLTAFELPPDWSKHDGPDL